MKNIKFRRIRNWLILFLLVGGISFAAYRYTHQKPVLTQVETVLAEQRTIYARVSESGNIQPTMDVPIAPDVSGEVVELYVREGQYVKKGQLLAVIRPDNYKAALEQSQASVNMSQADYMQAQATLTQSQANIAQDSTNLQRIRKLNAEKIVSNQELENAILKLNLSKSQYESGKYTIQSAFYRLKSSEASLKQAQQNLSRTNIYATMDGTITQLNVEVGQRVVGTLQMAGTEMMRIADLSSMEVVVDINENDITKLSFGDSAVIEVDALSDKKFSGKVTDIAYSATKSGLGTSDQVTSFQVKVRITPHSYGVEEGNSGNKIEGSLPSKTPFRPGMSSLVEIYTDKVEDVVAVPLQAVTLYREKADVVKTDAKGGWGAKEEEEPSETKKENINDEKPKEVVFILDKGVVKQIPVKLGISDDTYVEIKEGLSVGAEVVNGPYTVLTKELYDSLVVELMKK